MNRDRIAHKLLLYEALGFALLITVSWLDELIGLPSLLFGSDSHPSWHEAALETVVILAAAAPTMFLTRRLAQRLAYLEGFLRVCTWCRKVNANDRWMPIEEYFKTELNTKTTHGICQECSEKFLAPTGTDGA
jgi:hypothetical protein